MRKFLFTCIVVFCLTTVYAQDDGGKKAIDKQEKMDKKSTEMENATRKNKGRKSLKKMNKMEKKEQKLNKKADKVK